MTPSSPPPATDPCVAALQHLLRSAARQFHDSQADLETRPDRSLISFYIGLELTLKARLFAEHWALVLEEPGSHALPDLLGGQGATVGLEECLQRLTTVAKVHFSQLEKQCYFAVRKHRNRIVHFYHDAHASGAHDDARRSVLVDQWRAWPYLWKRITKEWSAVFAPVLKDLQETDAALKQNSTYLEARYDAINDDIAARTKGGATFVMCHTCEYDAAQLDSGGSKPPLATTQCLVCETTDHVLKTTCPKCRKLLVLRSDLNGGCECGYTPDPGIASHVEDEARGRRLSPRDEAETRDIVCGQCELPSVAFLDGNFLCCNCLQWSSSVATCEWCAQSITSWDPEGSFLTGCAMCFGRGDRD